MEQMRTHYTSTNHAHKDKGHEPGYLFSELHQRKQTKKKHLGLPTTNLRPTDPSICGFVFFLLDKRLPQSSGSNKSSFPRSFSAASTPPCRKVWSCCGGWVGGWFNVLIHTKHQTSRGKRYLIPDKSHFLASTRYLKCYDWFFSTCKK